MQFPCPNASCTYQFDHQLLPPAAIVTCPLCMHRFTYRVEQFFPELAANQGIQDASSAKSTGKVDQELSFDVLLANPEESDQPVMDRVVRRGIQKPEKSYLTYVMVGFFGVALLLMIVLLLRNSKTSYFGGAPINNKYPVFNFLFDLKTREWESDDSIRGKEGGVNVNTFSLKNKNQDAWTAMYAEDFSTRNPRPQELQYRVMERLRGYFRGLETQEIPDITWAGQKAKAMQFSGSVDGKAMRGTVYQMIFKGIGYIFFEWASEDLYAGMSTEFAKVRESFSLGNYRDDWKEKQSNRLVFSPADAAYQVIDEDGVWIAAVIGVENPNPGRKKQLYTDPKEEDKRATMIFEGENPRPKTKTQRGILAKTAHGIVVELSESGDPIKAAKNFAISRFKKLYSAGMEKGEVTISLEEVEKSPSETALPSEGTPIARFLVKNSIDKSQRNYVVVSALPVDNKIVVLMLDCTWADAEVMEPFMIHFAETLQRK